MLQNFLIASVCTIIIMMLADNLKTLLDKKHERKYNYFYIYLIFILPWAFYVY